MDEYIGLDVSLKETAVSIRRGGKRIWRGKCPSDPQTIAVLIRERAPAAKRVVFETGPLSVWFFHALNAEGVPAICIDARHAKAALDMAANKTVNRRPKRTLYRRPKGTPFVERCDGYGGRTFRACCGVGRA